VKTSLTHDKLPHDTLARLAQANARHNASFPGEPSRRQPVHTVYGGAHLFKARTCERAGGIALTTMRTYTPNPAEFGSALGFGAKGADRRPGAPSANREPLHRQTRYLQVTCRRSSQTSRADW